MAEGNSYTNILKMMKKKGHNKDVKIVIGTVKSPSPLVVDMGGYLIEDGEYFLTETVSNLISGNIGDMPSVYTSTKLKANDMLLVIIDDSDFYIIDRVV